MSARAGRDRGGSTADRRRDVERRLIDQRLVEGPRGRRAAAPEGGVGDDFGGRLHRALAGLGPVFGAFGPYLARRPDLLPLADCLRLEELARSEPPPVLAPEAVRQRLEGELAAPAAELFARFDPEPWARGPLHQTQVARLADGREVLVCLPLAAPGPATRRDLELLNLLRPALRRRVLDLDQALADFRRWLIAESDLAARAGRLEALFRDAAGSDLLAVPRVHRRRSGGGVLTVERLAGIPLEATEGEAAGPRAAGPREAGPREAARRLHLLWLEQVLGAGLFPVEAEVVALADGRLAVTGGEIAEMPEAARRNLWNYLRSAAAHDPDRACECLARELEPMRRGAVERDLLLALRQVVPFRDGSWSPRADLLAEHLVLHWRVSREAGFRPRPHLLAFFRGLFWAARLGHRLCPRSDPLRDALDDLRWLTGWQELRALADPRQLGESLETGLSSLLALPQKLDRVLDLATADRPLVQVEIRETAADRRRRNRTVLAVCLCLVLATLILLVTELGSLGLGGPSVERLSAVVFLAVGGALLWVLGRR